jgi:hypothetical protein
MWFFYWIKAWFQWYWPQPKLEDKPKVKPYEALYPLDTQEPIHESIENRMQKRVEETTPEGKVLLTYDENSNMFFYWAPKPIAYRYLEVVARKYVLVYDCKDRYVNMSAELLKAVKAVPKEVVKPIDSPFATFKSYNTLAHKKPSTKIANELGNVYKHIGKEVPTPAVENYKPISFAEFKKINTLCK